MNETTGSNGGGKWDINAGDANGRRGWSEGEMGYQRW